MVTLNTTPRALAVCAALLCQLGAAPALAQAKPARDQAGEPPESPARAGEAGARPKPEAAEARNKELPLASPRIHHAPPAVAVAGEPLQISAEIENPHLVKRALLLYRGASGGYKELTFQRGTSEGYVVVVPAGEVSYPSLGYALELETLDGKRLPVFASRKEPHVVQVPEDLMDMRERALDQRLGGRRSVFTASGEYVSFGRSESAVVNPATGDTQVDDRYYRVEGSYTYRPLRVVTEFSLRAGVLRGKSPVAQLDPAPGVAPEDVYNVGLNYGAPRVRFRFADYVHFDAEGLVSVTERGFSLGGGGAVLIGDPYGSKLTLGAELVQGFGNRFYSRLDIGSQHGVTLSPIIEVTNMPSANDYGVRLIGEVGAAVGAGFRVTARGGYQARLATSGGPSAGGSLSYAF